MHFEHNKLYYRQQNNMTSLQFVL